MALLIAVGPPPQVSGAISRPLDPNGDNHAALQAVVDAGSRIVRLPAGTWRVGKTVNLRTGVTLAGAPNWATEIRLAGASPINGPVVGWGGKGRWPGGGAPADRVTLIDLVCTQTDKSHTNNKCVWGETGDDAKLSRVRAKGSAYEGFVGGSWCRRMTFQDCEAIDCGNGGPAYALGTAGFNGMSLWTTYRRCRAFNCAQGFEVGNSHCVVDSCEVDQPAFRPSLGFNVGSSVAGVYDLTLTRCRTRGCSQAVVVGNGVGRLSRVNVTGNVFVDGTISFTGGRRANKVPHAEEGPDVYGSRISDNTLYVTQPDETLTDVLVYAAQGDADLGREPLVAERNVVHLTRRANFKPDGAARRTTPVFSIFGPVGAPVVYRDNVILGLDEPPSRGDFAAYVLGANAGAPNWTASGSRVFKSDGVERPTVVRREGARAIGPDGARREN